MRHDLLSDALSTIANAENVGKKDCRVPASKLVKSVLEVVKKYDFIGDIRQDGHFIIVELLGHINKAASVRPRFSMRKDEYEKFEKRYLPSKDIGVLIVSTSNGVMSHTEAKEKKIGGKILAYVY
jgi:small subunit ribosomal protein S8